MPDSQAVYVVWGCTAPETEKIREVYSYEWTDEEIFRRSLEKRELIIIWYWVLNLKQLIGLRLLQSLSITVNVFCVTNPFFRWYNMKKETGGLKSYDI